MSEFLLETTGLVKNYRGKTVVSDVDVNVRPGEIVGLLGPNGAGKTTCFYMIMGLVPADSGAVFFEGDDISSLPMYGRARRGMGYLAQDPSIFRKLTVEDNIMMILETLDISREERQHRLQELLERLDLHALAKQKAITLSGGERRRLEITRSLVTEPSFMMLDEPFNAIDPIAVHDVKQMVSHLKEMGLGILITDHSVRDTLSIVDRAYIMCNGEIICEGDSEFLTHDEQAKRVYLGPEFSS